MAPSKCELLRFICISAAVQKWFEACLYGLVEEHSEQVSIGLFGFGPGRQCLQITEFCRLVFQKGLEFSSPVFQWQADISFCFESIQYDILDNVYANRKTPMALRLAVLRETILQQVFTLLGQRHINLSRGHAQGRQTRRKGH